MSVSALLSKLDPRRVLLTFLSFNFLFLVLDVLIAHAYNRFASPAEWIPVYYSAVTGAGLFLYGWIPEPSAGPRRLIHALLWCGLAVGAAGFYFHLTGATFREFSLKTLVYAAPLVAPLAFAGLALAALTVDNAFARFGEHRRRALLVLAGLGFGGNLVLSVLDHARNGFFSSMEWVPVFAAAFTFIVLVWAGLKRELKGEDTVAVHVALVVAMAVGIIGFVLHLTANLAGTMPDWKDNFIYGAPVFAPLLFCDIAFLGFLALLVRPDFGGWNNEPAPENKNGQAAH